MLSKLLKPSLIEKIAIRAGARSSPLSKTQVGEVQGGLQKFFPDVRIDPLWIETTGDKDQNTSLRTLDKTDFFTKEIDKLVLSGECRIGVHSAKDLPDPIPEGLQIVAVTKGLDPSDSLVFREGDSLDTLPPGAKIATSSLRREEIVKKLRPDLEFIDLRGNIGQRLVKLENGIADGVVIAEAALIRLGLTKLNRMKLPGKTVLGQGQLAIIARESDSVMKSLFSILDTRPTSLYLGIRQPTGDITTKHLHYPLIKIIPRDFNTPDIREAFLRIPKATHLLFTSQNTVSLFFKALDHYGLPLSSFKGKYVIAIGKMTASCLQSYEIEADLVPTLETSEGIIQELNKLELRNSHFFWPHSALSRPALRDYFSANSHDYSEVVLYDTVPQNPGVHPSEKDFDQIIFTSPSTVDAYLKLFDNFPKGKLLKAIGPVTEKYLKDLQAP